MLEVTVKGDGAECPVQGLVGGSLCTASMTILSTSWSPNQVARLISVRQGPGAQELPSQ